jgi:isocitrate dehydrogenase (NAD+)
MNKEQIQKAMETFGKLIESDIARIENMQNAEPTPDYAKLDSIIIGVIPGDGIGPLIMDQTLRVLKTLVRDQLDQGKMEIREITGLSIDERAAKLEALPPEPLAALKQCHVVLKGPMTTPLPGDPWPSLPSSVAALRRALDLSVAVRPVSNPEKKIDWVMFRENIEGAYIWGSKGIQVDENLAVDFVVETRPQSLSVAKTAFEYARINNRKHVTAVTKANIVKLTDGNFLAACREVAKGYPEIVYDERLVDIVASKLEDPKFVENLEVMILPNLYGDIVSDVAAEICGGVSTAGSSNIGTRYALFEAIHGSATRMIQSNRGGYANPSSLIKAMGMMLKHIGYTQQADLLDKAMDVCTYTERKLVITGYSDGVGTKAYTDYILETIAKIG